MASEPCWVDFSILWVNGSLDEDIPEKQGRVHDMTGEYRVVTLHSEREICTLEDRDMAEAVLCDLQERRISEGEAEKIGESDAWSLVYSVRTGFRSLFSLVTG